MKYLYAVMAFFLKYIDLEKILSLVLSKYGKTVFCIIAGLLASLSMAPVNSWVMGVIGLVLFMMLSLYFENKKQVFVYTFLFFTAYAFTTVSWITFVMEDFGKIPGFIAVPLVLILSSLYVSLPYSILNTLAYKIASKKKTVFIMCFTPVAFILSDIYIYYFLTGFPWSYIGYGFVDSPLKNFAPFTGVLGINFFVYLLCASLSLSVYRKYLFFPVAASILIVAVFLEGTSFVKRIEPVNVTMVQANIKQQVRSNSSRIHDILGKYWALTKDEIEKDSLVLWPESAIAYPYEYIPDYISELDEVFKQKNATLVSGTISMKGRNKFYNSIITLGSSLTDLKNIKPYNKRALVPFGEVVPFADLLRPLGSIFVFPNSSFTYGQENQETLKIKDLAFTPAICYEAIFSGLITSMDSDKTNGIIMLTVDSWFGDTKAPEQHLNIARMRAMELQKPMLRATNSGITSLIDEKGNLVKSIPSDIEAVLKTEFYPVTGQTPYSKLNNIPAYVMTLLLLLLGIVLLYKKDDPNAELIEKMVRA